MGTILLAATPIGNPADASARLREALAAADVIAAEDTRRLQGLCAKLGVELSGQIFSLYEHNETDRAAALVERATAGKLVLVVTDAGTPTVSDPGFRLVRAAAAAGVKVSPLPGPSAALAALSVSGLPTDRFAFEGFLPRSSGEVRQRLQEVAADPRTLIFFESPRRTLATLKLMAEVFGAERPAALCRELTKTYEDIWRANLGKLVEMAAEREVLGEITIVVGGGKPAKPDLQQCVAEVLTLAESGIRLKDAAGIVAKQSGWRKNDLYREALNSASHPQS